MLNLLSLIPTAFAQNQTINISPTNDNFNSLTGIEVGGIIQTLITIALVVAGVVFLIMLIIGGIRWILSGGDKAQTETARNQITAALIGLVVVFAAYAIASLIGTIFGVQLLEGFDVPTIETSGVGSGSD